jgi:AGZA family xanthine/uracil permease-like MFS transporter
MTDGTASVSDDDIANRSITSIRHYFGIEDHDTSVQTEVLAGLTTFLTMSYIIVVNPAILSQAISIQGYSQGQVIQMLAVSTIFAAFIGTLIMGIYAKRPFGLAPGMGSNAFFAFTVVLVMGIPWQTALSAVFVEGLIFVSLTAVGARKYIVEVIPEPVKRAVGAGIGMFLLFLGLQEMHVVVPDDATLVALGDIATSEPAILATVGLFFTFVLWAREIRGAIILGIIATAASAWALTFANVVQAGVLVPESLPEAQYNIAPLVGAFIDGFSQIDPLNFVLVLFTFFVLDFFSTAGTLIGISQIAGFLDENGNLPEMEKPLMSDAIATTVGSMIGTSTVATFVESSTGIEEGGRTGLTAVTVALLFLVALIAVPLVAALPMYASHIALVVVGLIMLQGVLEIDWEDPAWAVSGGLTVVVMPLTFSIPYGLAAGIVSYPLVKAAKGDLEDIRLAQWALAIAFVGYFYIQTSGMLG